MKLVIVESPAKCSTIKRYLGDTYTVKASLGHIRDLSTKSNGGLGVNLNDNYAPAYVINKGKEKVVNELISLASSADEVILATDPDREGEAIAWHLAQVLGLDVAHNKRLEFHEITRESINHAINNPRVIDKSLVESQETRRIIDRIIGFKLSNLLRKKIHSQSAGRVQSATLKLIHDHQKEIDAFVPDEYWNINVSILVNSKEVNLTFVSYQKHKEIKNKELADKILESINSTLTVKSFSTSTRTHEAAEPFMTATLQQEAFVKLGFSAKKTAKVAQSLYEGISFNGEHMGLITYTRTDVTRMSETYLNRAKAYIVEAYGSEYLSTNSKHSKKGNLAQDAHECIRPTKNHNTPSMLRPYLTDDQYALYRLIYNHTLAYLMKPKVDEVLTVHFESDGAEFKTEFKRNIFKGYEIINGGDNKDYYQTLPTFNSGDKFTVSKKSSEQKFTQPPALYTEAKVVRLMQEKGIGRPSTYASTIDNLQKREYIVIDHGEVHITEKGKKTSLVLNKYFPEIVDDKYTATMETKLDNIQEGDASKVKILDEFYLPFKEELTKVNQIMYKDDPVETGEFCPKCGAPLVIKNSKNGDFIGCSNYPNCDYIKKEEPEKLVTVGKNCPKCGAPLVYRKNSKGKKFIACSAFPTCDYTETNKKPKLEYTQKDYVKKCPDCETGWLVKKRGKYNSFLGCTNYPNCKHMEKIKNKK